MTQLLMVAPLIWLTNCVGNSATVDKPTLAVTEAAKIAVELAKVCPKPSTQEARKAILAEVEATISAGVPPDTLAGEYRRLNKGAEICVAGAGQAQ